MSISQGSTIVDTLLISRSGYPLRAWHSVATSFHKTWRFPRFQCLSTMFASFSQLPCWARRLSTHTLRYFWHSSRCFYSRPVGPAIKERTAVFFGILVVVVVVIFFPMLSFFDCLIVMCLSSVLERWKDSSSSIYDCVVCRGDPSYRLCVHALPACTACMRCVHLLRAFCCVHALY